MQVPQFYPDAFIQAMYEADCPEGFSRIIDERFSYCEARCDQTTQQYVVDFPHWGVFYLGRLGHRSEVFLVGSWWRHRLAADDVYIGREYMLVDGEAFGRKRPFKVWAKVGFVGDEQYCVAWVRYKNQIIEVVDQVTFADESVKCHCRSNEWFLRDFYGDVDNKGG